MTVTDVDGASNDNVVNNPIAPDIDDVLGVVNRVSSISGEHKCRLELSTKDNIVNCRVYFGLVYIELSGSGIHDVLDKVEIDLAAMYARKSERILKTLHDDSLEPKKSGITWL